MTRVLHINTLEYGGAAIAARRLHEGLLLAGHDSRMLVQDRGQAAPIERSVLLDSAEYPTLTDPLLDRFFDVVFRTCRESGVDVLFSTDRPVRDLSNHPLIQWADVINLHWLAWMMSAPAIAAIQALGKPVVWTIHDQFPFTGGCHYSGSCEAYKTDCATCPQVRPDVQLIPRLVLLQKRQWIQTRRLTVVSPSRWLAGAARTSALFHDTDIRVIPNGLPVEQFQRQTRAEARRLLGLPPTGVILLFGADNLGEKRKGYAHLSAALKKLASHKILGPRIKNGSVACASFGRGDASAEAVPISHLGTLSGPRLTAAYRAADIFVLPTLEDNLPNTMIESVSAGTPIVGYATGGVADVVEEGGCGVVVQQGDVDALSRALIDLTLDDSRREAMRPACEAYAARRLSLKSQADDYARLYDELLHRPTTLHAVGPSMHEIAAADVQTFAEIRRHPELMNAPFKAFRDELAVQETKLAPVGGTRASRRLSARDKAVLVETRARLHSFDARTADLERLGMEMAQGLARMEEEGRLLHSKTGLDWLLDRRGGQDTPSPLMGSGDSGLVSVIVPVHNNRAFLEEAVRSVWAQTLSPDRIEIVLVDDGSSDGSYELARQLEGESPCAMRTLTHPDRENRGVSASRNLALTQARGEFIALLDGDDVFLPDRLAVGLDYLRRHPECHVVCSLGRYIDQHGRSLIGPIGTSIAGDYRAMSPTLRPPFVMEQLWEHYPVTNSTLLVRRQALASVGAYPEDMAQGEDRLVVLKLSVDHPVHFVDEPLIHYRHHPDNATSVYVKHGFEGGIRLDLLYKLVHWMVAERPEQRHRALALFRRNHQLLLAYSPRSDRARQELIDRVCAEVGLDAEAYLAQRARESAELEVLRKAVPTALRDARDARAEVERLRSADTSPRARRCA